VAMACLWVNDRRVSSNADILLAVLGGGAITAVATPLAVLLTARRTARAELSQRRMRAYADLLVAVGDVLGTYRRTWDAMRETGTLDADEANKRMAELASVLHQASAVVALTGSGEGRRLGAVVYAKARKLATTRVVPPAAGTRTPAGMAIAIGIERLGSGGYGGWDSRVSQVWPRNSAMRAAWRWMWPRQLRMAAISWSRVAADRLPRPAFMLDQAPSTGLSRGRRRALDDRQPVRVCAGEVAHLSAGARLDVRISDLPARSAISS
jgi:hypothetical protein